MVLSPNKGMYFDGHERDDVVEERVAYLKKMAEIGFLFPDQAATNTGALAFPKDIPLVSREIREKTVCFFHDESTFNANEDQHYQWGVKGEHMLRPKSKGAGMMVSDFVDEHNGYLALTNEEYDCALKKDKTIKKQARVLLEYGESKEG